MNSSIPTTENENMDKLTNPANSTAVTINPWLIYYIAW
jgi:hypothetical protein